VLATASFAKMKKHARLYWWYGLQDFKLKVGLADDDARVRWLARYLGSALGAGGATLRLDANGAWSLDEAIYRLSRWKDIPIAAVEQPLAKGDEQALGELRASVRPTIYLDESLVTLADGKSLVETGGVGGFNIRLSKCGGLMASLRLAALARRNGVGIQLGCMVGETSILSAAGRRFLELVPDVRFVEGSFGGLLMRDDIVRRSLRFGFGGRVQALPGYGWGVDAGSERLDALSKKRGEFVL
jgi:muconate cycloisomerase